MQKGKSFRMVLLAGLFSGAFSVLTTFGQSNLQQANLGQDQTLQPPLSAASAVVPAPAAHSRPSILSGQRNKRGETFYKTVWGIEGLEVREAASGSLLRFRYRVVDASRAQMLNDKKASPYLIEENTGAVLQVPSLPKVGPLRDTSDAENGKEYWIAFSNKGVVKPGSRVDVVIGNFRAIGLVVR